MGQFDRTSTLARKRILIRTLIFVAVGPLCFLLGLFLGNEMRPKIRAEHEKLVDKYATDFALAPKLVEAVILVESGGDPAANSAKGAKGLMQLMPDTAKQLAKKLDASFASEKDLMRPEINIRLGCYYLHLLIRRFDGELALALAAYNTGPNRVEKWLRAKPHSFAREIIFTRGSKETRLFVTKVLRKYGHVENKRFSKKISQKSGGE